MTLAVVEKTLPMATITGRTDRQTDRQTERQTDRVRRIKMSLRSVVELGHLTYFSRPFRDVSNKCITLAEFS